MKKIFLLLIALILFQNISNAQPGWNQVTSGTTKKLYSILNLTSNSNEVWITGQDGLLLRSNNNGTTFTSGTISANDLYDIDIVEQVNGGICIVGSNGLILKTTNDGTTFFLASSGVTTNLTSIIDNFCAGDSGVVLKSNDGGSNWVHIDPPGPKVNFNDLFVQSGVWVFVVGDGGKILRYGTGSNTWVTQTSGTTVNLNSVNTFRRLVNGSSVFGFIACGDNGVILTTTNLGNTWIQENSGTTQKLNSVIEAGVFNQEIIWSCGVQGKIFSSNTQAINWALYNPSFQFTLNQVSFGPAQHGLASSTGFMVGDSGIILKALNYGITTIQPVTGIIPSKFKLNQNYPNPFNPETKISFDLPENAFIDITIYDISGKSVTSLVNGQLNAGSYGVKWNAAGYSSGIYFCRINAGEFNETMGMILLK